MRNVSIASSLFQLGTFNQLVGEAISTEWSLIIDVPTGLPYIIQYVYNYSKHVLTRPVYVYNLMYCLTEVCWDAIFRLNYRTHEWYQ